MSVGRKSSSHRDNESLILKVRGIPSPKTARDNFAADVSASIPEASAPVPFEAALMENGHAKRISDPVSR